MIDRIIEFVTSCIAVGLLIFISYLHLNLILPNNDNSH